MYHENLLVRRRHRTPVIMHRRWRFLFSFVRRPATYVKKHIHGTVAKRAKRAPMTPPNMNPHGAKASSTAKRSALVRPGGNVRLIIATTLRILFCQYIPLNFNFQEHQSPDMATPQPAIARVMSKGMRVLQKPIAIPARHIIIWPLLSLPIVSLMSRTYQYLRRSKNDAGRLSWTPKLFC